MSDEENEIDEDENTSDNACSDHDEATVKRGEKGRWQPGRSANPAGRPKGSRRLRADVVPIASAAQLAELARRSATHQIEILEEIAASGKKETARLGAIAMLQDRGFGKPNQPISGGDDEALSAAQLRQLAAALQGVIEHKRTLPAPMDATPGPDGTYQVEVVPAEPESEDS